MSCAALVCWAVRLLWLITTLVIAAYSAHWQTVNYVKLCYIMYNYNCVISLSSDLNQFARLQVVAGRRATLTTIYSYLRPAGKSPLLSLSWPVAHSIPLSGELICNNSVRRITSLAATSSCSSYLYKFKFHRIYFPAWTFNGKLS